jgi:hypothetical protein
MMTTPDTTTPGGDNAAMMGFLKSAIAELMNSLGPNEDLPPTFIFLRRATEPVLVQFAHLAWPEQRDEALSLARSLVALCSPWAAGILVFGWAAPDVSQGQSQRAPGSCRGAGGQHRKRRWAAFFRRSLPSTASRSYPRALPIRT